MTRRSGSAAPLASPPPPPALRTGALRTARSPPGRSVDGQPGCATLSTSYVRLRVRHECMRLLHVRLPPRRSLGSTIAPYWRRPCGARTRLRPSEVRCPNGWAIGRLGSRSCACNRALFTRDCTSSRSRRPSRAGHHCRARRASPVSDRLFLWCECSKGPAIVAARTHPTGSLRVFDYDVVSPRVCYGLPLRSGAGRCEGFPQPEPASCAFCLRRRPCP
jgi:hypothetical protein